MVIYGLRKAFYTADVILLTTNLLESMALNYCTVKFIHNVIICYV